MASEVNVTFVSYLPAETVTDARPAPSSLPSLTRQPSLQRLGAGYRIKAGNDGKGTPMGHCFGRLVSVLSARPLCATHAETVPC